MRCSFEGSTAQVCYIHESFTVKSRECWCHLSDAHGLLVDALLLSALPNLSHQINIVLHDRMLLLFLQFIIDLGSQFIPALSQSHHSTFPS